MNELGLIPKEALNPAVIFTTDDGINSILRRIEDQVSNLVFDVNTPKGRKECASTAYKVAQSKTYLDGLGKDLVSDWKEKSRKVDINRKIARDFLESLKDKVRSPLTDWEIKEERRIAAEKLAKEIDEAHEAAFAENALFDRQREIERKEAELARIEAERREKEETERLAKEASERQERLERERKEREDRIAHEAEERAKREAEMKIKRMQEESARREREMKEAAIKAEQERIAAIERAKVAQEMAVKRAEEKARLDAEKKERERIQAEKIAKDKVEKLARNKAHRAKVMSEVIADLQAIGGNMENIANAIADGKVRHVNISFGIIA